MKPFTDMHAHNHENEHRMAGLLALCPWLRAGNGKTLLYVGAMPTRQDFLAELIAWGWTVDILEAWAPYHAYLEQLDGVRYVYAGDIQFPNFTDKSHDVVFWWHGPEHLPTAETVKALANCERLARHAVVIGMPFGETGSGATEGNHYNEHKSAWYGPDIGALGYQWRITSQGARNITAVKMTGGK